MFQKLIFETSFFKQKNGRETPYAADTFLLSLQVKVFLYYNMKRQFSYICRKPKLCRNTSFTRKTEETSPVTVAISSTKENRNLSQIPAIVDYLKELNILSVIVRILLAIICGGVIGIERRRAHQSAGMRTYMLVCMGAAIVMATGQYMYDTFKTGDPSRLGAQVISGIGFLGAGSIITSGKTKVRGLTTAAGLWVSACIGLALGIGFYSAGLIATLVVYLIMARLKRLEYRFLVDDIYLEIYLEYDDALSVSDIAQQAERNGLKIEEVQHGTKGKGFQKALITFRNTQNESRDHVLKILEHVEGVRYVKYIY